MPQYPKKELAQLVIQLCVINEIENVVISPGSRSAPLIIGFVNHPKINTLSVVDERSAAFFALGMAQQLQKPVALLCSSGSALLNYYPAIAEAYYSNIPLVVISADRPKHLIDIGDGQTIRQENVFTNHILFNANLKEIRSNAFEKDLKDNEIFIKSALKIAKEKSGPVHINVPFDEPLYEVVDELIVKIHKEEEKLKNSLLDEIPLEVDELQKYADVWNAASKKMVLLGTCFPDKMIQTQLDHIIKDPSVLVLTETTSNVYHNRFINSIDQLIFFFFYAELKDLQPDILLTFGGMIVSKKIKQFLRKLKPDNHWHIDKFNSPDTYHCLSHHFQVSPQLFFSQFFFLTEQKESEYQKKWIDIKSERKRKHNIFLEAAEFSDLQSFEIIFNTLPDHVHLQLSNSSVVRYAQLFDIPLSTEVFCNRGTSGIDGSTSTAIGAAYAQDKQTVFLTGDISFFYDSNALWNKNLKNNFRIILINNSGGGIFRFIPGPKTSNALEYFETPHQLNAANLCEMFDVDYCKAENKTELEINLKSFFKKTEKPKLFEIFTNAEKNDIILKDYFISL